MIVFPNERVLHMWVWSLSLYPCPEWASGLESFLNDWCIYFHPVFIVLLCRRGLLAQTASWVFMLCVCVQMWLNSFSNADCLQGGEAAPDRSRNMWLSNTNVIIWWLVWSHHDSLFVGWKLLQIMSVNLFSSCVLPLSEKSMTVLMFTSGLRAWWRWAT